MLSNISNSFDQAFADMQKLADSIRLDVEKSLETSFKDFEVLEHQALKDPKHNSVFMKVKTDDNGHVRLRTSRNTPDGKWVTHIEEYDRGLPESRRVQDITSNQLPGEKGPLTITHEA